MADIVQESVAEKRKIEQKLRKMAAEIIRDGGVQTSEKFTDQSVRFEHPLVEVFDEIVEKDKILEQLMDEVHAAQRNASENKAKAKAARDRIGEIDAFIQDLIVSTKRKAAAS